jgi:hypothetical protein
VADCSTQSPSTMRPGRCGRHPAQGPRRHTRHPSNAHRRFCSHEVGQPTLSPHFRARRSLGDRKRSVSMLCLTRPDARRRHPAKALRYNPQRNSGLGAEYDYLYGPILVRFRVTSAQPKPEITRGHSADEGPAVPVGPQSRRPSASSRVIRVAKGSIIRGQPAPQGSKPL